MSITGSEQWMYNAGGGFYSYAIDNSLRFEGKSASSYLQRTHTAGSNTTWTFSWWFKPDLQTANNGTLPYFFATSGNTYIRQQSGQGYQIEGNLRGGGGTNYFFSYAPMLRDPSAWYHCVIAVDTSQGTSGNRIKFYLNGEQQTTAGSLGLNYPPQNHNTQVNTAVAHRLGAHPSAPSSYAFSGYMSEINFVDGSQLNATSFGETKSGIWIPKDTSGLTFGTNGFRLEFADSAAIGDDTSGNTNDYTSSGLAATDQMPDSPTNNFATFNPLDRNSTSITSLEGNLKASASSSQYLSMRGTMMYPQSGKWYMEFRNDKTHVAGQAGGGWGLQSVREMWGTNFSNFATHVGMYQSHNTNSTLYRRGGSDHSYGLGTIPSIAYGNAGDIFQIAFDCDSGKVWLGINNSWMGGSSGAVNASSGNPSTGANPVDTLTADMIAEGIVPMVQFADQTGTKTYRFNAGQDSTFQGARAAGGNADANGLGDFVYAPPTNFLSMCSANMPKLAIDPADDDTPADYFNTVLYSGTGAAQSITGVGFQPDFVWLKGRSYAEHHHLYDTVRGATKVIYSNRDVGEQTDTLGLTSFDSDGFSIGSRHEINKNANTFVGWNWLAGGAAVSNTDGGVTSQVSANTKAGFSILTYTAGSSLPHTVGHGLDSAPELVIYVNRDSTEYILVGWDGQSGKGLKLNDTTAAFTTSGWNTLPTATTINHNINTNDDYLAYCFHSVEGYSKVGKFTGRGSETFVALGFRPAWIMVKNIDTDSHHWVIYDSTRDSHNVIGKYLYANTNASEADSTRVDFVSNGFVSRVNSFDIAQSGVGYIYLAFAEQPQKFANAR